MTENIFELSKALSRLIRIMMRGNLILPATVEAVNDDFTCDVTIGESTQYAVPIKVLTSVQASVLEVPVVGSDCLISFRDGNINQPQIIFVDQIDQLLINCKSMVQFNGGELGGMVKVVDLLDRLNNIENLYNNLVSLFNSHTHTGVTTGAGVSGPTTSHGSNSTLTTREQLENTKIQQ